MLCQSIDQTDGNGPNSFGVEKFKVIKSLKGTT